MRNPQPALRVELDMDDHGQQIEQSFLIATATGATQLYRFKPSQSEVGQEESK